MARPRRSPVVALVLCALVLLARPALAQEASTTTSRPRLTTTSVEPGETDGGDRFSTGNKVVVLIVGLVVLALVLIVFTWRYWRATTPARASAPSGAAAAAPSPPARKSAPTV